VGSEFLRQAMLMYPSASTFPLNPWSVSRRCELNSELAILASCITISNQVIFLLRIPAITLHFHQQLIEQRALMLYFLPSLLTAWCRTIFEKLIVTQLVKKHPASFMESDCSLPCSQKSATGPYLEPAESSSPHRSLAP